MGLLKKLVGIGQKPFRKTGLTMLDPLGTATGAYKEPKTASAPAAAESVPTSDQSNAYYGDQADSAYGSFTQPFDVEQFYKYQDPGYWFRLQQGNQALMNSAAAGSGALSGAALKDLLSYNQYMASTEYGNAFNRYQTQQGNIFSRLFSLAQLGQGAAAGVGSQGTNLAGNAGQAFANAGSASGAGIVGAGNAINSGITNAWLWNQLNQQRPVSAGTGGV